MSMIVLTIATIGFAFLLGGAAMVGVQDKQLAQSWDAYWSLSMKYEELRLRLSFPDTSPYRRDYGL